MFRNVNARLWFSIQSVWNMLMCLSGPVAFNEDRDVWQVVVVLGHERQVRAHLPAYVRSLHTLGAIGKTKTRSKKK